MDQKGNASFGEPAKEAAALEKIEEAICALKSCKGELTAEGYTQLRRRLGDLMDTLYNVGEVLSKST